MPNNPGWITLQGTISSSQLTVTGSDSDKLPDTRSVTSNVAGHCAKRTDDVTLRVCLRLMLGVLLPASSKTNSPIIPVCEYVFQLYVFLIIYHAQNSFIVNKEISTNSLLFPLVYIHANQLLYSIPKIWIQCSLFYFCMCKVYL